MKNKKVIIGILLVIIILIAIITTIIVINQKGEKPEETLNKYISFINEQKYEEIYNLISEDSKTQVNQEDFIKRNKNIYEGIDAVNIEIEISDIKKEKGITKITYSEKMTTSAGNINFTNIAKLVKEDKQYKINWVTEEKY